MARESGGHVPVARISAVAAVAVGTFLVLRTQTGPHWRTLGPGVEFATLRGEPYCRRGSSAIAALRLDPAHARLRVLHYSLVKSPKPLNIVEWQRRTGALAIFNAGQFYPDWSYMGLLISSGRTVSADPHPGFKAALVASPVRGAPRHSRAGPREAAARSGFAGMARGGAVLHVVRSHRRNVRVRRTDHVSNRTAVIEDTRGRIVVITTEGGYTLADLADWVRHAPLAATHAMAMDGGYEAEMCVRTPTFRYASFGRWDDKETAVSPGAHAALPAVISVESE